MAEQSLDWVPLYVYRLIESEAWKLPDYKFCWYMKLLIKSVTANPPGYLPGSVSELWQLAGAKSEAYFVKWGGPELVSQYFKRTDDGTNRIYNRRMLDVIGEQSKKLNASRKRKNSSLSSPVVDVAFGVESFDFPEAFEKLFTLYPRRKRSRIIEETFCLCVEKVAKRHGFRRSEAGAYILSRTEIYVQRCEPRFIAGMDKYLENEIYEQDESMWEQGNGKRSVLDEI